MSVSPKKHLGQHFLTDENIAKKIVDSLVCPSGNVIEVGPGEGVLSKYLFEKFPEACILIEKDYESVAYLREHYPNQKNSIEEADFLKADLKPFFTGSFSLIGNFPYNISSQIFFRVLDHRDQVEEVVGMIQKEVAERIASSHGSKRYGILSVLLQAFYEIEYLFTVNEGVFFPPPKVKSAVIRLTRNKTEKLDCDEALFFKVVKAAFNQRRKMLRNSLSAFSPHEKNIDQYLTLRPEQVSVQDFVVITRRLGEATGSRPSAG